MRKEHADNEPIQKGIPLHGVRQGVRDMSASLTQPETELLQALEVVIQSGMACFVEVGAALLEISDKRLYRKTHATFKDYCREKWKMSARRAYQLCEAAEAVKSLPENVNNCSQITNEGQAREVAKVKPEKRARVVREAAAKAEEEGKPMAARHIAEAAREDEPEHERPHVVIHEEALGSLKAGRVLKSFDAWLSMNFPDADERKWAVGLIRDHVEDLISQSGAMR